MESCLRPWGMRFQPPPLVLGPLVQRGEAQRPGRGRGQLVGTAPSVCLPLSPESNSGNPSREDLTPKSQQGTDGYMRPGQGPRTLSGGARAPRIRVTGALRG